MDVHAYRIRIPDRDEKAVALVIPPRESFLIVRECQFLDIRGRKFGHELPRMREEFPLVAVGSPEIEIQQSRTVSWELGLTVSSAKLAFKT
jgi:hypothetical protein